MLPYPVVYIMIVVFFISHDISIPIFTNQYFMECHVHGPFQQDLQEVGCKCQRAIGQSNYLISKGV